MIFLVSITFFIWLHCFTWLDWRRLGNNWILDLFKFISHLFDWNNIIFFFCFKNLIFFSLYSKLNRGSKENYPFWYFLLWYFFFKFCFYYFYINHKIFQFFFALISALSRFFFLWIFQIRATHTILYRNLNVELYMRFESKVCVITVKTELNNAIRLQTIQTR